MSEVIPDRDLCAHDWQPVKNYGRYTGFLMCAKCGDLASRIARLPGGVDEYGHHMILTPAMLDAGLKALGITDRELLQKAIMAMWMAYTEEKIRSEYHAEQGSGHAN